MLKLKYINLSREKTQSQVSFVPWRSPARLVVDKTSPLTKREVKGKRT